MYDTEPPSGSPLPAPSPVSVDPRAATRSLRSTPPTAAWSGEEEDEDPPIVWREVARDVIGPHGAWQLLVLGVAIMARLVPVVRGGGLHGALSYDGSVYYAASAGLAHGLLPYKDFLLLHPPGIVMALLPFAMLGRLVGDPTGMAAARLGFMIIGGLNAVLVMQILRRSGAWVMITAGLCYAVAFPAVFIERAVSLEAVAALLLLGCIALLTRNRLELVGRSFVVAAGVLAGLSAGVKIWGVVLVLAVAVWCALHLGRRLAAVFLGAAAGGVTVLCLPFFLAAPTAMWRMVVLAQLGRPRSAVPLAERLVDVTGVGPLATLLPSSTVSILAGVVLGIVTLAAVCAVGSTTGRLAVALLAGSGIVLILSPTWFVHYGGLAAAPIALTLGAGLGQLRRRHLRGTAGTVVAVVVVLSLLAAGGWTLASTRFGPRLNIKPVLAATQGVSGCVTADDPTVLIEADLVRRNLARHCPYVIDLGGYNYELPRTGPLRSRNKTAAWQALALDYLRQGDVAVTWRFRAGSGFSATTARTVRKWQLLGESGSMKIWAPTHP